MPRSPPGASTSLCCAWANVADFKRKRWIEQETENPALQKAGIEMWAVSTAPADGPRGQRAFSKHLNLPFPLLPDPSRKISLLFGAVQTKQQMAARMSVFFDKQGIVRSIDKQIDIRTHGADVLARVQAGAKATPAP